MKDASEWENLLSEMEGASDLGDPEKNLLEEEDAGPSEKPLPKMDNPPDWKGFLLVCLGAGLFYLPWIKNFLESYWLFSPLIYAYLMTVFLIGTNRPDMVIKEKTGLNIKTDAPDSGSLIFLSLVLASFFSFETFTFGMDFPWYLLPMRWLAGFCWFSSVLIALLFSGGLTFTLDDKKATEFLRKHNLPIPPELDAKVPSTLRPFRPEEREAKEVGQETIAQRLMQGESRALWERYQGNRALLKESTANVDTYTLEAALFGGLAFSSIVSIISSDKYQHEDFTQFLRGLAGGMGDMASLNVDKLRGLFSGPSGETDWVILFLLLLSILSTAFFLASLFCRIPFSRAHRECEVSNIFVGSAISAFRKRLRGKSVTPAKVRVCQKKLKGISESIDASDDKYHEIDSIMNIMRVFRVLGLLAICLMLVGVCARVEPYFGWLVAFLIAIGFSNMMGNPMALLLGRLRKAYSIRKYPRKNF